MWHREPAVEQLLNSLGIKWDYVTGILVSKIKLKESLRNNPRIGDVLDEDLVDQHAYKMSHGVKFPAPVLYENGTMVAGGNHRCAAAVKIGLKAIDSYVVKDATEQQVYEFIRMDNIRHGKNLSDDQKLKVCLEEHRKYGTSLRELNDKFFGGNDKWYTTLCNANRAEDVRQKLLELKLPASYATSILSALSPISNDRNVLREIGLLMSETNMTVNQVNEIVRQVQEKPTESERVQLLKEARATVKAKESGSGPAPETSLRRELTRMQKFLSAGNDGSAFPAIEKLIGDPDAKKELKVVINEIINSLKRLKDKV